PPADSHAAPAPRYWRRRPAACPAPVPSAVSAAPVPYPVSPDQQRSAQLVDFIGQTRVAAGVEGLDIREAAVDIAELAAHFPRRARRIGAHALPEFGVFVGTIKSARLGLRHPGDEEIGDQRPWKGAH